MYDKISKGRESPNCVYVIRMETLLDDLVQKRKTSFDRDASMAIIMPVEKVN